MAVASGGAEAHRGQQPLTGLVEGEPAVRLPGEEVVEPSAHLYLTPLNGRNNAHAYRFVAGRETARGRIAVLEQNRELIQAVTDYNRKLVKSPGQQASAERRIAEATRQLDELDRELAELRKT